MIGCEYLRSCYMKDIQCFWLKWDYCPHKETVAWLEEERKRKSKEITDTIEQDFKLQMEWACI